jgi:hypothetical protein
MYSADTLLKMAEQKRQDIQRDAALRRLASDNQAKTQQSRTNIIQKVVSFLQRFTEQPQQDTSINSLENVESTS